MTQHNDANLIVFQAGTQWGSGHCVVFQDNAPGACPGQRGARPPPTMARELGRARGWLGVARVLSKEQVARLVDKTKELTKKAAGKSDVTKAQVRGSALCKASVKTIQRRFKEQKFTYHTYKEMILLSAEDK